MNVVWTKNQMSLNHQVDETDDLVFTCIDRIFSAKPLEAIFLGLHRNTEVGALGSKHWFTSKSTMSTAV